MKKTLLILFAGLLLSLPTKAQWNPDTNTNFMVTPEGKTNYGCTIATNNNGISYVFMEMPENNVIEMRLQILDKEGNKMFPEEGILISDEPTMSYTVVGKRILIDDEGNAIFSVSDQRTGAWSYTLYKYNEKGEQLWGDVQLNEGKPLSFAGAIDMCQTDDGGYVVTYMCNEASLQSEDSFTQFEKFDRNGNVVWTPKRIGGGANDEECSNAHVIASIDNQCILTYAKGSNKNLMARMLDFEGENIWGDDMVVYNGGNFGTMPLHVMMNVYPGPDGGAIFSWSDGRNNINYQNCISYITNEGTHVFSTGVEGTNVSNDDMNSRKYPELFYDEKERAIFCVFYVFNQASQGWNGLFMQKISFDGELLWGPNGKAIFDIQDQNRYGYQHIRDVDDKQFAVFCQERIGNGGYGKVNSIVRLYDKKTGEPLSEAYNFSTSDYEKSDLEVSELIDGKYFLANWKEGRRDITNEEDNTPDAEYIQKVSLDAVSTGIEEINGSVTKYAKTEIFSADGKKLSRLGRGVNIVRTTNADGKVEINKITN